MSTARAAKRAGVRRYLFFLILVALLGCQRSRSAPVSSFQPWGAPVVKAEVVSTLPHDTDSFTQGLLIHQHHLYEGTGRKGRSRLRKIDLTTGEVQQEHALGNAYFGEGLALLDDRLYQLTWQSELAFVYDLEFKPQGERIYLGEGWGLTTLGQELVMSNGSQVLNFLKPSNFMVLRSLEVTAAEKPVAMLNELEVVEGEIWANVYTTDYIARIDPSTGKVTGWVDLRGLLSESERRYSDVLNGIAYDQESKKLYVTGKLWPKIFEIKVP